MTDRSDWTGRVGDTWAREWERTDRSFSELTPHLLASAEAERFAHAVDIGCGAGETTAALALRHPNASVLGIDISAELAAVAAERCSGLANVTIREGDVACADLADLGAPDLLLSRHGVMFFPDPTAAFAHIAARSAGDARLVFSCFRQREENAWVSATLAALPAMPPPPAPGEAGPFAFADQEYVNAILAKAGWREIGFAPVDYGMVIGEGERCVEEAAAYLRRIGPAARALAMLDDAARAKALARLGAILEEARQEERVSLPAAAWIVTARKA